MSIEKLRIDYNHAVDQVNWIFEYIGACVLKDEKLSDEQKLDKIRAFVEEIHSGKREGLITLVSNIMKEYRLAAETYPPFNSPHEGYAIILEELEELKVHVFQNASLRDIEKMKNEARQVAAMSLRFMFDVCPHENDIT